MNQKDSDKFNASFTDVIARYDQCHKPSLKYEGGDFYKWQSEFKRKVLALKGRDIERVEPELVREEECDVGTHIRKKVVLRATEISDASGYLLLPKKATSDTPAIIASHGHVALGKYTIAGHPRAGDVLESKPHHDYGRRAVESGYIVFAPDWWGWGDKSGHVNKIGNRDKCNVIQVAASMYGFSVPYLHMLECNAIVDYLQSLSIVDADRIAIIGNSYGGRTAMWMAAFNDRIKCTVSTGAMNLFSERASKLTSCALQYFPGLLRYGDVGEVYSLIAPRPLQLQAGTEDQLITPRDRDRIADTVRKAYKAAEKPENLSIEVFEGGHLLNWDLAQPFLERHL